MRLLDLGLFILGGVCALSPLACGDDVDAIATELKAAVPRQCAAIEACACASWAYPDGSCEDEWSQRWEARARAGDALDLTYDAGCAAAQVASLESVGCSGGQGVTWFVCQDHCSVFHGDGQLGAPCTGFDEVVSTCDSGLVCRDDVCADPCEVLTGRGEGERCGDRDTYTQFDECAVGSYCDIQGEVCRARVPEGASCEQGECELGLACQFVGDTRICVPNESSFGPSTCVANGCPPGRFCRRESTAEPVCIPYQRLGERCEYQGCEPGSTCDLDISECVALPSAGEPCVFSACAPEAWCDDTEAICRARLPFASPCTGHRECESGYCPLGFCDVLPQPGEPCGVQSRCASGLVCDGDTCEPARGRGPAACIYSGW